MQCFCSVIDDPYSNVITQVIFSCFLNDLMLERFNTFVSRESIVAVNGG
jgi:hypothetical protein